MICGFHVFEGVAFGRKKRIRQKGIDIMIAVDMLRHSFRKNMDKAALLTGDLDFKPLLEALNLEGMYTTVYYSNESISKELLFAADDNFKITIQKLYEWSTDTFRNQYCIPEYKINYRPIDANVLKGGYTKDEKLRLLTREDDKAWIEVSKNDFKNSGFWCYHDKDRLVKYYEDFTGNKITWDGD